MEKVVCLDDIEALALAKLDSCARDYYKSGADEEVTLGDNRKAFRRLYLRPRVLTDVSKRNLEVEVLGQKISFPVGIAPTAMQRMAHPDGEVATCRAAHQAKTVMILSTIATTSVEELAKAEPDSIRWFQLYIYRDRSVTQALVRRAEASGFRALVLTVDTPIFGHRRADSRNKFALPPHLRLANFVGDDTKSSGVCKAQSGSGLNEYASGLFDPSLTWEDVRWLRSFTSLPIVIKGILTAEDAIFAVKNGADAILVSNHGARQLDGVPATVEALPEVVRAVGDRCEVYLDGGVRTGTDVVKALALGARAVFIGRPVVWGLACNGQEGVSKVLEILRREVDLALALSGCTSAAGIPNSIVARRETYSRM
ncbi:2-Hydroxyacid oxidase 1-like [Ornithodoros turicata]|uniref:2-Hydroxyacid oxidase 1-like n=1 Tax=Ornithodoros turicata TaxID=34597 RepID=UPI0031389DF2